MEKNSDRNALLERLRTRDLRSGSSASKFSQNEGRSLIKDFLFRILDADITKSAFVATLEETMLALGNQMQKSWAVEPVRLQIIRRIQSKNFIWPDQDLRLFLFLILEKIIYRAYELSNQSTNKLPVQAMMKLHLNELATIDYADRVHIIELLRRWAGNQWEEAPNKAQAAPTNWSECVKHMKSVMERAFEGNTNPVITSDFYAVLRGFMLSLMLLSIMDEQFFVHSLRSLMDLLENETYTKEFIVALKDHVQAQKLLLEKKQRELFSENAITSLGDKYDLRVFWRIYGRKFTDWIETESTLEARTPIADSLDDFVKSYPDSATEHEMTFLADAVGIIMMGTIQPREDQKFDKRTLAGLLQACNATLNDAGLKMMNLRLMAASSEYLDNSTYAYIGPLYELLVVVAKKYEEIHGLASSQASKSLKRVCDFHSCKAPAETKETAPRKCSACQLKVYCSAECQKADWPLTHKKQCSKWRSTVPQ